MFELAYKKERAAARKLQRAKNLTEEQALFAVLKQSAAPHPLEALLAERRAEQDKAQRTRAQRQEKQRARLTNRLAAKYPPDTWLGWFDGSAFPNPGRIRIGAVLQSPDSQQLEISADAGHGDSSTAEYLALHALLEAAIAKLPPRLVIYGDSRVVIDDVLAIQDKSAPVLAPYRAQVRALMTQLQNVDLIWVPRHRNQHADALSQMRGNPATADTTER